MDDSDPLFFSSFSFSLFTRNICGNSLGERKVHLHIGDGMANWQKCDEEIFLYSKDESRIM